MFQRMHLQCARLGHVGTAQQWLSAGQPAAYWHIAIMHRLCELLAYHTLGQHFCDRQAILSKCLLKECKTLPFKLHNGCSTA
jgi:hypothetical protein